MSIGNMLSCETFEACVGTAFSAHAEPPVGTLMLMHVTRARMPVGVNGVRHQPFSLCFKSQTHVVHPQGIYELTHPVMGTLSIFLVPSGRADDGVYYDAVFT